MNSIETIEWKLKINVVVFSVMVRSLAKKKGWSISSWIVLPSLFFSNRVGFFSYQCQTEYAEKNILHGKPTKFRSEKIILILWNHVLWWLISSNSLISYIHIGPQSASLGSHKTFNPTRKYVQQYHNKQNLCTNTTNKNQENEWNEISSRTQKIYSKYYEF